MQSFIEDPIVRSKFKECATKRPLNMISTNNADGSIIIIIISISFSENFNLDPNKIKLPSSNPDDYSLELLQAVLTDIVNPQVSLWLQWQKCMCMYVCMYVCTCIMYVYTCMYVILCK